MQSAPQSRAHMFDRFGMLLSALCGVHCFVLPLLFVMLPFTEDFVPHRLFHVMMILLVLPVSVMLVIGWREHRRNAVLALGAFGVAMLLCAVSLPEEVMTHDRERVVTTIGGLAIAIAHWMNMRNRAHALCTHDDEPATQEQSQVA